MAAQATETQPTPATSGHQLGTTQQLAMRAGGP